MRKMKQIVYQCRHLLYLLSILGITPVFTFAATNTAVRVHYLLGAIGLILFIIGCFIKKVTYKLLKLALIIGGLVLLFDGFIYKIF